jgi:hypothetical protein
MHPHSLCAQVLKAKYFPHSDLLDLSRAGEASVKWLAVEYGVELLKRGAIRRIGDGESTRIWRDNWIPRTPNMRPINIHPCLQIMTCLTTHASGHK